MIGRLLVGKVRTVGPNFLAVQPRYLSSAVPVPAVEEPEEEFKFLVPPVPPKMGKQYPLFEITPILSTGTQVACERGPIAKKFFVTEKQPRFYYRYHTYQSRWLTPDMVSALKMTHDLSYREFHITHQMVVMNHVVDQHLVRYPISTVTAYRKYLIHKFVQPLEGSCPELEMKPLPTTFTVYQELAGKMAPYLLLVSSFCTFLVTDLFILHYKKGFLAVFIPLLYIWYCNFGNHGRNFILRNFVHKMENRYKDTCTAIMHENEKLMSSNQAQLEYWYSKDELTQVIHKIYGLASMPTARFDVFSRDVAVLEEEVLQRQQYLDFYQKIKRSMDFAVELKRLKGRWESENRLRFIASEVMSSITPEVEDRILQQCISQLALLPPGAVKV